MCVKATTQPLTVRFGDVCIKPAATRLLSAQIHTWCTNLHPLFLSKNCGSLIMNSVMEGFGVRQEVIIKSKNARLMLSVRVKNENSFLSRGRIFTAPEQFVFDVTPETHHKWCEHIFSKVCFH